MCGTPDAARMPSMLRCSVSPTVRSVVGLDQRLDVETVDVHRLVAGARGHLLAADDQELLVGAVRSR